MHILSSEACALLVKACADGGAPVLRLTGVPFELMAAGLAGFDYARRGAAWRGYTVTATEKGRAFAEMLQLVGCDA